MSQPPHEFCESEGPCEIHKYHIAIEYKREREGGRDRDREREKEREREKTRRGVKDRGREKGITVVLWPRTLSPFDPLFLHPFLHPFSHSLTLLLYWSRQNIDMQTHRGNVERGEEHDR